MNCTEHVALVLSVAAASGGFLSDLTETPRIPPRMTGFPEYDRALFI